MPAAASWNRAPPRPAPTSPQRPPFRAQQQPAFNLAHHLGKAGVLFQPLKVFQTVAARKVQDDQPHDHLEIEPPLFPGDPHMLPDRNIQPLIRSR
jgi:hypothetical protein